MADYIALDENILFRRVLDEGVVVDQRKAQVLVVNEVAVRILELIRETCPVEKIVSTLMSEYDASESEIKADVVRFLKQLEDNQMTGDR